MKVNYNLTCDLERFERFKTVMFNISYHCGIFIDKDTYRLDERWNGIDDIARLVRFDLSWAISKDETEGAGAELDGNRCIFVICYTADFYRYIVHF